VEVDINIDRGMDDYDAFAPRVRGVVEGVLARHADFIAHVEVRLNEENQQRKGQAERRCLLEARFEGSESVAVTHQAATTDEAVRGAAEKMTQLIENCFLPARRGSNPDVK
jgi:hypothetical protein